MTKKLSVDVEFGAECAYILFEAELYLGEKGGRCIKRRRPKFRTFREEEDEVIIAENVGISSNYMS